MVKGTNGYQLGILNLLRKKRDIERYGLFSIKNLELAGKAGCFAISTNGFGNVRISRKEAERIIRDFGSMVTCVLQRDVLFITRSA